MLNALIRFESRSWTAAILVACAGVGLLLALAVPLLDRAPVYDELLHILAARGLLAEGQPVIADGGYFRALAFTQLVAASLSKFGDNLWSARLPALVPCALLIVLIGVWTTRRLGSMAGLVATCLLAMSPSFVFVAGFTRFYGLHALLIAIATLALERAIDFHRVRLDRAAAWASVCLAIALGSRLAPELTFIATGALSAAAVAVIAVDQPETWRKLTSMRRPMLLGAVLASVLVIGLLAVVETDLLSRIGYVPVWAQSRAGDVDYYIGKLSRELPLAWPLFPAAILVTLVSHSRVGLFCAAVATVGLAIHSVLPQKDMRYVVYLLPCICIVVGGVAAHVSEWSRRNIQTSKPRISPISGLIILATFLSIIGFSQEGRRAAKGLAGDLVDYDVTQASDPSWSAAVPVINVLLAGADAVVVSNSMKAIYYLGDYDYEISATVVRETDTRTEFGVDPRTGRPIISLPESLMEVLDLGRVILVIEDKKYGSASGVLPEVVDVIKARCTVAARIEASALSIWMCDADPKNAPVQND